MPARPYGDNFLVATPALDRLEQRVYQEQRQRDLYRQQQNQNLDNEFSRNLAGIRDADIGDLTKAYGDFKMSYMGMLRQKHGVTPAQQLDVLRKKAQVYDVINKSKQDKEWEKAQGLQIMKDTKGIYADDAHDKLMGRINTPLSQLDRSKDADLLYQYSMPNLDKELKFAQGEPKEVSLTIGQSKTDPLQDDKEVYKVGNSPTKYYNSLLQGIVASNKGKNFTGIVSHKYNDQELEDLQNKYYAKINDPKFIAVYGKPEPFPESASKTDLGRAVAIETMENVVSTPLAPIKTISEVNQDRKMSRQFGDFEKKEAIRQKNREKLAGITDAYAKGRMDYKEAIDDADAATADVWIDDFVDGKKADAVRDNDRRVFGYNGKQIHGVKVPMDEVLATSLGFDAKNKGEVVLADGKFYKLPYKTDQTYEPIPDKSGKGFVVDVPLIRQMDDSSVKLALGKKSAGVKQLNKEMTNKPSGYTIKGKSYTEKQLLDMGYSAEQIAPYKNK